MKKTLWLVALMSIAIFSACQKQKSEVQQQQPLDTTPATSSPEAAEDTKPRIAQRPPTESYDLFYTMLEPYGSWFETTDYGFVWQPHEAQSGQWRPYLNGHWVYTDLGWTWVSEEPFGWATYHYGRWTRLSDVGWIWVPGEEWAPAWVSWRKSDDYVGWAPLPPEARLDHKTGIRNWADNYYDIGPAQYCFVPVAHFGAERLEQTVAPPEQNVTIINRTTNITNITFNNMTVVNEGPNYDELRRRGETPIPRLKLERKQAVDAKAAPQTPVIKGEVLELTAPIVRRARPANHPRAIKRKISQLSVENGWSDAGDAQVVNQVREKMKAEATPPSDAPRKSFVNAPSEPVSEATPMSSVESSPSVAATSSPGAIGTGHGAAGLNPSASASVAPSEKSPEPPSPTPSPINKGGMPGGVGAGVPPAGEETRQPRVGDRLKSQAQRFNPRRVEPMPSPTPAVSLSPSASPTSCSSGAVSAEESQVDQRQPKVRTRPFLPPRRKPGGHDKHPTATPTPNG